MDQPSHTHTPLVTATLLYDIQLLLQPSHTHTPLLNATPFYDIQMFPLESSGDLVSEGQGSTGQCTLTIRMLPSKCRKVHSKLPENLLNIQVQWAIDHNR